MKSGFIPSAATPDELIAGTDRGGQLPPEVEPDEASSAGTESGELADSIGAS
jgi:hypothetical protein